MDTFLTMLSARAKGSPRSLAKDHVIREAAARHPIALQNSSAMMMLVMMEAPTVEPVACKKMRMNMGTVELESSINDIISGALNSTETSMLRARHPLVLAFLTSSDICTGQYTSRIQWPGISYVHS